MPVVPRYNDDVQRAPKTPISAGPESFGAASARGLKAIAGGLRSVEAEADRIREEDNEAQVSEALLGAAGRIDELLHDPDTGYLAQKGKNAMDARPQYRERFAQIQADAMEGVTDPRARRALSARLTERLRAGKIRAADHYRAQRDVYHGELSAANVTQAQRDIANDPLNPEAWNRGLGVIERELEAAGRRTGLPAEALATKRDTAISKTILGQISRLADSDPAAALELYGRDDLKERLTPEDRAAIEDLMKPVARDVATARAKQLYGADPEAMATALGLGDAGKRDPGLDALPVEARRKLLLDAQEAQVKARKAMLSQIEPRLRRAARDGGLSFDELRTLEAPGIGKLVDTPEGLALVNELEAEFSRSTKGRAALAKFIERVQGGGRLSPYDADDRKLADAAFESAWEAQQPTNAQAEELRALGESYGVPEPKSRFDVALEIARHGAAPDVLIAEAREGLDGDVQTRIQTLEKLSTLGENARATLSGATNGDKVAEALTRYGALRQAGYAPHVAVEFAAPSSERSEVLKAEAADLKALVRKEPLTEADLIDAFGPIDGPDGWPWGDPDEVGDGVMLGDVAGLMAEYRKLVEIEYVQAGGDLDAAKKMAGAKLLERYAPTFLTDEPQVMQSPPDTALGTGDEAKAEVKRQLDAWMEEHAPEGAKVQRLIPEYDERGEVDGYSVVFEAHGELGRVWDQRFRVDGSEKRKREIEHELETKRQAAKAGSEWMKLYAGGVAPGSDPEARDAAADPEGGEPDADAPPSEGGASGPGRAMGSPAYRIGDDMSGRQPPADQGANGPSGRIQMPDAPETPEKAREDDQGRLEIEGLPLRYAIAPITYSKSRPQKVAGIVLHHTAPMEMDQLVRSMQTRQRRGGGPAAYYGYHFAIGPDGEIVQAAPLSKRTNHVRGPSASVRRGGPGSRLSNGNTISISFVGAAEVNSRRQATGSKPTSEQVAAARRLINGLRGLYDIPADAIFGHGELQKDRHGDEGAALARELRGG